MSETNLKKTDEVFPRIFMSDYLPAQDWKVIQTLGITHIVPIVKEDYKPRHEDKGIKYLVL